MLQKAGLEHLVKHLNTSSRIVMRADFNVPIDNGKIQDPNRIKGIHKQYHSYSAHYLENPITSTQITCPTISHGEA